MPHAVFAPLPNLGRRRAVVAVGLTMGLGATSPGNAWAQTTLPVDVELALKRAKVPSRSIAVVVQDVGNPRSRLTWNAGRSMNPASLEKLLTTTAALDLLGPAWTWRTRVWLDGTVEPGTNGDVLDGRVVIEGAGDPKLVAERLWLLMQRLRQTGLRTIRGDIVVDQSAFDIPEVAPERFDNEPLRPYNVRPQPLLVAQKSLQLTFTPWPARGVATVGVLPALDGVTIDATVPLDGAEGCANWRAGLAAQWSGATRLRFDGRYPTACGERVWPMAYPDPAGWHARVIASMWSALGGTLTGAVIETRAPAAPRGATKAPAFEFASPPLSEVARDINKYSNNTMAQQLFLTLSLQRRGRGTWEGSREELRSWLAERVHVPPGEAKDLVVDNGSGLSRESRLSASLLARVLQHAWRGAVMPELMASLPVGGVDGTLRRAQPVNGRAYLKTGSLRDVAGIAGYVMGASGKRSVVVAIVNDDQANAARPALDALVNWVADDQAL